MPKETKPQAVNIALHKGVVKEISQMLHKHLDASLEYIQSSEGQKGVILIPVAIDASKTEMSVAVGYKAKLVQKIEDESKSTIDDPRQGTFEALDEQEDGPLKGESNEPKEKEADAG